MINDEFEMWIIEFVKRMDFKGLEIMLCNIYLCFRKGIYTNLQIKSYSQWHKFSLFYVIILEIFSLYRPPLWTLPIILRITLRP